MKKQSVQLNMFLNSVKSLMGVIFPLITFPYATKILGADNIGMFNFSLSLVSYFSLVASLGIPIYAVQEGARLRDNKEKITEFTSQLVFISIFSTACSYILLFICMICFESLSHYQSIIIILSLQICFATLGMEWIFSIYEDYLYITVRTIFFQVISLGLLFLFVKNENDLLCYAGIYTFSNVISNIINIYYSRKYIRIKKIQIRTLKVHLRPIFSLFAISASVLIYVNSDVVILGVYESAFTVGIYALSVKIYTVLKTILGAMITVSIPRLVYFLGNNEHQKYNELLSDIIQTIVFFLVPIIVIIFLFTDDIIMVVSTSEFLSAIKSMQILLFSLVFCMGAWIFGQCVLVPNREQSKLLSITLFSAVINIMLNILFIPYGHEIAAAYTTAFSEAISFFLCVYYGRKYIYIHIDYSTIKKIAVGSIVIFIFGHLINNSNFYGYEEIYTILKCIASFIIYCIVEAYLKNEVFLKFWDSITKKMLKRIS